MKKLIFLLTGLLMCSVSYGQWKAQSGELPGKSFRLAYVTSKSGKETLRILRNIPAGEKQKSTDPYDQVTGQILLSSRIENEYQVRGLVFRFDDSQEIFVHQPSEIKQGWDAGSGRFIIESDWKIWRRDDLRDKETREIIKEEASIPEDRKVFARDIIQMLKAHKTVVCQVILVHRGFGTQSVISAEFSLQGSTKSVNFLFQ